MSDQQPPKVVPEAGKKKRKVVKKKPTQTQAEEIAAPVSQTRPKYKLTFEDRQHFDYVRELTNKNVWCGFLLSSIYLLRFVTHG